MLRITRQLTSRVAIRAISIQAKAVSNFVSPIAMQKRGIKTLDFGGTPEKVWERADYPPTKLDTIFKNDVFAVIGYGTQGMAQSLNLRDSKRNVIVGVRKNGHSWKTAIADGWIDGKNLFPIEDAIKRGSIVMNLLSDAGQKDAWPMMKPLLTKGKTLFFSHGFSIVFHDQTGVIPPKDIDVILAAPKGSGATVRSLFLEGRGINSSIAVFQDVSGNARERALAMGIAIGSGYLYETTL